MQYQVPQFIGVEDKIVGPLTIKQFIYCLGAGATSYIFFKLLPLYLALWPILIFAGLFLSLAFYKPNSKPFLDFLQSAILYVMNARLYVWKHVEKKVEDINLDLKNFSATKKHTGVVPMAGNSLGSLAWQIDIAGDKNVAAQKVEH